MRSYRVGDRRAVLLCGYMAVFSFGLLLVGVVTNAILIATVGGCGVGWFTACALGAAGRFGEVSDDAD